MGITTKVVPQDLEDEIVKEAYEVYGNVTICFLTLKNGIMSTGINHGSVDPANFSAELGREYSRKGALEKIWPLLGFRLADKLHLINSAGKPSGAIYTIGSPVTYVGTKVIHAVAMTRADYNTYRGWELPSNENGEDNGYLVEYADGGKPNVEGHPGYVSWSPADVFERAYGFPVRQEPETFLSRMEKESRELAERYDKLVTFTTSAGFNKIPEVEQLDLLEQRGAMARYLNVLMKRIGRNSK